MNYFELEPKNNFDSLKFLIFFIFYLNLYGVYFLIYIYVLSRCPHLNDINGNKMCINQ